MFAESREGSVCATAAMEIAVTRKIRKPLRQII
jgi:hypothetical protein